jgi:hypothetical protein
MPARREFVRALWILVILLVAALVLGGTLAGCRKVNPPGDGSTVNPGGTPGSSGGPLQVAYNDNRLRQGSAGYYDFDADYLGGSISPGQEVLVGEGDFLVTLVWSQPVTLEGIKPFIVLDPPPTREWNWLPEWQSGSTAQFMYREADRSVLGVAVTLKAGLPLGGGKTLEADYAFTIRRCQEPSVTATVAGLPWVKAPYDRVVAGYVVQTGRYEARFEFSETPDRASAEKTLGTLDGHLRACRWDGDRALLVTADVAAGATLVFDLNGTVIPGSIRLGNQTPLVLVGAEPTALACLDDPGDPASAPRSVTLKVPLRAGDVAPQGGRVLLWEVVPNLFDASGESPTERLEPWVAATADGAAEPLGGIADVEWGYEVSERSGWSADGRLILPVQDRAVAVSWASGRPAAEILDGPTTDGHSWYLSRAVSPDGRTLAWLEFDPSTPPDANAETLRLVVLDLSTGQRREYPKAAPVRLYESVYYERPRILWTPLGEIALTPEETLPAASLRVLDPTTGRFAPREFVGPDGKTLLVLAWTVHSGQDDWRAKGLAVGVDEKGAAILVSSAGRQTLDLGEGGTIQPGRLQFSPAGELLAVECAGRVRIFRCPSGDLVQAVEGQLAGFSADGKLWLVVPASGG